ncbi:MAG: hypothetical protein LKF42_03890 [Streptococcaceae bacterium]|jgi:hypothetical protein|nr:hypothetical protein [Streptococcaceae bacterium]MCH4176966.1 hypothetical protein [Streptococcaceae bacterium]
MNKKKICFVLWADEGLQNASLFANGAAKTIEELKKYLCHDYEISTNYIRDNQEVDYLIVPTPFTPFKNERELPVIKFPAHLIIARDFKAIKQIIDSYFNV